MWLSGDRRQEFRNNLDSQFYKFLKDLYMSDVVYGTHLLCTVTVIQLLSHLCTRKADARGGFSRPAAEGCISGSAGSRSGATAVDSSSSATATAGYHLDAVFGDICDEASLGLASPEAAAEAQPDGPPEALPDVSSSAMAFSIAAYSTASSSGLSRRTPGE